MTVYVEVPIQEELLYHQILQTVGYWGQTSSFTCCVKITHEAPEPRTCALPLRAFRSTNAIQPLFLCVLTEFRKPDLTWQEAAAALHLNQRHDFRLALY